jgi:hypothetical protein
MGSWKPHIIRELSTLSLGRTNTFSRSNRRRECIDKRAMVAKSRRALYKNPVPLKKFTTQWLRPDPSKAFIQSGDGRYLTELSGVLNSSPPFLRPAEKTTGQPLLRFWSQIW